MQNKRANYAFLITIIFIIIILCYFYGIHQYHEYFSNNSFKVRPMYTPEYLYPTKNLQNECEATGLEPAYGPTSCFKDGQYIPTANCKCREKSTGDCKSCYPKIKHDDTSSTTIYKADNYKL